MAKEEVYFITSFEGLNEANTLRCKESFYPITEWSPTDWMTALTGEVGEAANLIKKLRRGENIDPMDIGDELADAVIYIDLLCERMGLNLKDHIVRKFNEVSNRVGSNIYLSEIE